MHVYFSKFFTVSFCRESMERVNEQLKSRLDETVGQLQTSVRENELAQEELDRLQARHQKLLDDMENKERTWRER